MNAMMHERKDNARRRGQSMLEGIIAIGIIITAVSSALTLVQSSVGAEKDSETSIVASNLAREAIEVAHNVRDSNWLAGNAFDDGLYGASDDYTAVPVFDPSTGGWTFDFSPNAVTDSTARVYRYTTGSGAATVGLMVQGSVQPANTQPTLYRRLITFDPICRDISGTETVVQSGSDCGTATKVGVRVTAQVRWEVDGRTRNESMVDELYDWR